MHEPALLGMPRGAAAAGLFSLSHDAATGEVRSRQERINGCVAGEFRSREFRAGEFRAGEFRVGEVRVGEVRVGQVRAAEVRAA